MTLEPLFLTVDEVQELHDDQLRRFGGSAGVRDLGALRSAVATPASTFDGEFLHADLCQFIPDLEAFIALRAQGFDFFVRPNGSRRLESAWLTTCCTQSVARTSAPSGLRR